jgi:HEPN domain-containing protein
MKDLAELTRGWLRKAESDMISVDATLQAGALDSACFHAQQAAEKYLKAFLTLNRKAFPYTHNLGDLVELCAAADSGFRSLTPVVSNLTPYAVQVRYDDAFWPALEVAEEALSAARTVRDFVRARLSKEITGEGER